MPGKSSFDERHPLSLGSGGVTTTLPARRWLDESDVLFAVGSSMTRSPYGQPIPDGKTIIHNVEGIEDINKDYSVAVGLPGDAKLGPTVDDRGSEGVDWRDRTEGTEPGLQPI